MEGCAVKQAQDVGTGKIPFNRFCSHNDLSFQGCNVLLFSNVNKLKKLCNKSFVKCSFFYNTGRNIWPELQNCLFNRVRRN